MPGASSLRQSKLSFPISSAGPATPSEENPRPAVPSGPTHASSALGKRKREPLADVAVNVSSASGVLEEGRGAGHSGLAGEPGNLSTTLRELRGVSPKLARDTLRRLEAGYVDKSGSGYPAAVRTPSGCLLAQKPPNRADNGYIQIAPISTATRGLAGSRAIKQMPQNAHRLVVIGHGTEEERRRLVENGDHASHRCGQPTCIEPSHIVVESKADNEARKACKQSLLVGLATVDGVTKTVWRSSYQCDHTPSCIARVAEGVLVAEDS